MERLPDTTGSGEVEVVDEVTQFHQDMAIREADEGDRDAVRAIDHYIASGEHLLEVQARLDPHGATGAFKRWVENHYLRSRRQADRYMRLARNKHTIQGATEEARPTTLEAGLRYLSPEKEEKDEVAEVIEVDSENLLADRDKWKDWAEKRQDDRKKQEDLKKRANKKVKEQDREIEKLRSQQQELSSEMRANVQKQLAEVYARYGIEEKPTIFEVDEETWQQSVSETTNKREKEAGDLLLQAITVVKKMRKYEPEEAARAYLKWPSPERSKEAIEEISDWLEKCKQEMESLTTPGQLRAVGGKGK